MAAIFLSALPAFAGPQGDTVREAFPPTITVMSSACRGIAGSLLDGLNLPAGDSLELRTDSLNDGWIAQGAFTDTMRRRGYHVFDRPSVPIDLLRIQVLRLTVRYDDLQKEGLFGAKSVERTIDAEIEYALVRRGSGEVIDSGKRSRSISDRVAVDAVGSLETPAIHRTQATVPPDTFLDRAVEPFLILGAAGVAVYLLFHIRS